MLQSTGHTVLTLIERWASGVQTCQRPVLVVTGIAGAIGLILLYSILLLIRARREARKFREELAELAARRQAAESTREADANLLAGLIPLIRTPINTILSFIDLALKTGLDSELREHLDTLRTSADWLSHIANDVHELSRIEAGELQVSDVPFSISECLRSALKLMEPETSARKLVTGCKIDPQVPDVVCGDPTRLRYLVFNLLEYAVSFTASGDIILSAALASDSADDVLVRVAITGTGVEIPPAERLLLLELFRQADAGTVLKSDAPDLGLVISRRLVGLMGGSMESRSQLGAGSIFEFTVRFRKQQTAMEAGAPVYVPVSVPESAPVSVPKSLGLRALSILVAEDNALTRGLLTKGLESAGHRVWAAANSIEIAHNVQTEGFDLILMDLEMPNSLEATRAIRAAEAPGLRVPICALTAHTLPADRNRWAAAGIDSFIAKPIAVDHEVLQLVSELAAQPSGAWTPDPGESEVALEAIPGNATDFLHEEEPGSLDSSAYLFARAAGAETNGFSDSCAIAIDGVETLVIQNSDGPDSGGPGCDENALREVNLGAEIVSCLAGIEASYDNSDDSGPAANVPLSAPAGLALLEASGEWTQPSAPPVEPDRDPFAQARKSLSKSSFGIRVIHSDGDPSERNLI
jgi:signal transduction histidine kinase/ActR/RegA family two-component response regulator